MSFPTTSPITSTPKLKVAIVGAGPAGCILARLLQHPDIEVLIFESEPSPDYRSQGGTLDLHQDTGLYALKRANLYDEFLKSARMDGDALAVCDKHMLHYLDLKSSKESSYFSQGKPEIDRTMLRKLLYDCLPESIIRWGHRLRTCDEHNRELLFDNGVIERGFDLIVGADGAWSKIRLLLTTEKPFFSGVGGYNLIIPHAGKTHPDLSTLVNRGSIFSFSDGKVVMGQQMGDGSIYVSVWCVKNEDWMQKAEFDVWNGGAVKEALTEEFREWDPQLLKMIQATDDDSVTPRSLFMLPVGMRWNTKPGITMLGDAAHLMTPFVGEGVNCAFRDAVDLSEAVRAAARERDVKQALNQNVIRFERQMLERVTPVQAKTDDMMHLMLFTEGAPRTVIEQWCIRAMKDELNAMLLTMFRVYIYIHFFFFKLLH
ncbi:MAG: hypothetical protein Q9225_002307 [Loekoesia sp. 1 TL-2023]